MKWKSLAGWPYEVSNGGDVRRNGRVLKPIKVGRKNCGDYFAVVLSKDGMQKTAKVHRLVWTAFKGEIPDKALVLHNDGNRFNNKLSNLRLGTHKDNAADMRKHNEYKFKLSFADRNVIRRRRAKGETGAGLAREFGVSQQYVCDIVKGRIK